MWNKYFLDAAWYGEMKQPQSMDFYLKGISDGGKESVARDAWRAEDDSAQLDLRPQALIYSAFLLPCHKIWTWPPGDSKAIQL